MKLRFKWGVICFGQYCTFFFLPRPSYLRILLGFHVCQSNGPTTIFAQIFFQNYTNPCLRGSGVSREWESSRNSNLLSNSGVFLPKWNKPQNTSKNDQKLWKNIEILKILKKSQNCSKFNEHTGFPKGSCGPVDPCGPLGWPGVQDNSKQLSRQGNKNNRSYRLIAWARAVKFNDNKSRYTQD